MKKTVSILLSAALTFGTVVPVLAADVFKDVNKNSYSWAQDSIEYMAEEGLINGYGDGTFLPGKSVSRMEAFTLFARLMGTSAEENGEALEAAKEKYADVLSKYELGYAEEHIAYMLMRGVLTESELDTYFAGNKKSEPMMRYEAAVLITKAMLAENEAKSQLLIDMDYNDVSDIPKDARNYVYYVGQKGIMVGMDGNMFSPKTDVLRSQIAVMLARAFDSMNYGFERVQITDIDTSGKTIEFLNSVNQETKLSYTADTKFFDNGEEIAVSKLKAGQTVVLTMTEAGDDITVAFADRCGQDAVSEVSLIYSGYASIGGNVTINTEEPLTGKTASYSLYDYAEIIVDGVATDLNKLKKGSYVTLALAENGEAVKVTAIQESKTVKDLTLVSINLDGTIIVDGGDYDGQAFIYADDVKITKNGNNSDIASLYRGDSVNITLEYGIVKRISATSDVKTVKGIIKSYTISATNPTVTIKKDGEEATYDLPYDAEYTINGEKARLADFEMGCSVTLTIESDAVKKIAAESSQSTSTANSVTGVVSGANESANVIILTYNDGDSDDSIYITCTSKTKFNIAPSLTEYSLKKIKKGDTIVAYGEYSNGIFVASGVTVISTAE